jgi:hypothetical protein
VSTALVVRDLASIDAEIRHHRDNVTKPLEQERKAVERDNAGRNWLHLAQAHLAMRAVIEPVQAALIGAHHAMQNAAAQHAHQHAMNMAALKAVALTMQKPPSATYVAPAVPFKQQDALRDEALRILAAGEHKQLASKRERITESEFSRRVFERAAANLNGAGK